MIPKQPSHIVFVLSQTGHTHAERLYLRRTAETHAELFPFQNAPCIKIISLCQNPANLRQYVNLRGFYLFKNRLRLRFGCAQKCACRHTVLSSRHFRWHGVALNAPGTAPFYFSNLCPQYGQNNFSSSAKPADFSLSICSINPALIMPVGTATSPMPSNAITALKTRPAAVMG